MIKDYGKKELSLDSQKYLAEYLNRLKTRLYISIYDSVDQSINELCPDIYSKPIYEFEDLTTRTRNVLKEFEKRTGIIANIETFSKMSLEEFKRIMNKNKIHGIGQNSLDGLSRAIKKYGFSFR